MMMEKFLVTRQCYWLNKAWFNTQDRPHEIMFGVYTVDGGLIGGELRMSWAKTPAEPVETARLIVPEGAWGVLASCEDVLFQSTRPRGARLHQQNLLITQDFLPSFR